MAAKTPDERDQKILTRLKANSRIPISELARSVNLSPTAVRQRIARMEKDQVIKGYTINTEDVDGKAIIKAVMILRLKGAFCKILMGEFGHLPEIQDFWSLTGELDAIIKLHLPNIERLNAITTDFNDHKLVVQVQTHIITETHISRNS